MRVVVFGKTISALPIHLLAFSAWRNVCFGYLCDSLLPEPAPSVAFITGTYEAAAGPVNQKRPLSASGSLQLFRLTVADAPG